MRGLARDEGGRFEDVATVKDQGVSVNLGRFVPLDGDAVLGDGAEDYGESAVGRQLIPLRLWRFCWGWYGTVSSAVAYSLAEWAYPSAVACFVGGMGVSLGSGVSVGSGVSLGTGVSVGSWTGVSVGGATGVSVWQRRIRRR